MTVNFMVTGLLILKISLVHRDTSATLGHVSRLCLGRIVTALIESGAILFCFQTLYLVLFCLGWAQFDIDSVPCAMLYVSVAEI